MVFSSLIFLYGFFSLSLAAYFCCRNQRQQNTVLLIFSLIFYSWGEPKYVLLLMLMAFVSWLCARKVEAGSHKKAWAAAAVGIELALIGYFKYAGLICSLFGPVPEFVQKIALPIGISFYTFQLLTYVVDVYRGEAPAQKSYWNVLLYAALFHQCIAGPIVRYKTIDRELFGPNLRQPEIAPGVSRFCAGLAKKVLLANPCGALADSLILSTSVLADPAAFDANLKVLSGLSVEGAWLGIAAYSIHIYLDFSAYSDMAIGMGRMIGLHYLENFNYPYISRSVTEFWRRWHMSLGTFFRDYVYIPLGGSRCSLGRMICNTLIVWSLTGLWHGASWNYLLWGLWFFVFLILERLFLKKWLDRLPVLSNVYVVVVVFLSFVIFRFQNISLGLALAKSMFGLSGNVLTDFPSRMQLQSHLYLLLVCIVVCTPAGKRFREKMDCLTAGKAAGRIWHGIYYSLIPAALLLLSTACLVGDSYNPFIYFQF